MFIKNLDRFLQLSVHIRDGDGSRRHFIISNKRSNITVDKSTANLPLTIKHGWQYLCLDLQDLTRRCFGTKFISCYRVNVHGPALLAKVFFQSRHFADVELPSFLRIVS